MEHFSTAELRAYQQICLADGALVTIACDQRNAMRALLSEDEVQRSQIGDDALGVVKSDIVQFLGSHAGSVLLDPVCAVPEVVRENTLPKDVGLILGLDASGFDKNPSGFRMSRLAKGLSARRLRQLGATAGKIMVYLRADQATANDHNIAILNKCIEDFSKEDVLLVVEFLTYQLDGESESEYQKKLPELVEGATEICLSAGAKLLKIPYPTTQQSCARIHEMCNGIPWSILSAGVDHEDFLPQIEIAVSEGAAGVIAGRALWKDCVSLDRSVTRARLEEAALPRLDEIKGAISRARSNTTARIS